MLRVVGTAAYQSQQVHTQGMYPGNLSSVFPQYHNNYPGQPASGYQWSAASYQGQMPSSGYPGPPSGPVYPGQPPGRTSGGMNNDGFQPHPMNSTSVPYQQFNNSTPGGAVFLEHNKSV